MGTQENLAESMISIFRIYSTPMSGETSAYRWRNENKIKVGGNISTNKSSAFSARCKQCSSALTVAVEVPDMASEVALGIKARLAAQYRACVRLLVHVAAVMVFEKTC